MEYHNNNTVTNFLVTFKQQLTNSITVCSFAVHFRFIGHSVSPEVKCTILIYIMQLLYIIYISQVNIMISKDLSDSISD